MSNETFKGVARNTSMLFLQQLVTWASTFVLLLFLPRYLGPVEYGRLFLVVSVTGMFLVLVNYGANFLLAKHVARERDHTASIVADALVLRLLLWVVSLIGMIVFSLGADYPPPVTLMLIVAGIGLFWDAVATSLYGCYQGNELLQYTSAGIVAKRVFISIGSVVALLLGAHVMTILIILIVGSMIDALVLAGFSKKMLTSSPRFSWQGVRRQLREGFPYFLLIVFGTIYYRIDTVMLSKMCPEPVVGWYGAAYRLFDSLSFVPHLINVALYPVLSRLWKDEAALHRRTVVRGIEYVLLAAIPITILVFVFSPEAIALLYGSEHYEQSVLVLQLLTLGLVVLYIDMMLGTTLLSSDQQRKQALIAFAAIPLNIGLNFLLIPQFQVSVQNGGVGAAIGTVITELFVFAAVFTLLPKGFFEGFRHRVLLKGIFAGASMVGAIWMLRGYVPWFLLAPSVMLLFCAVLFWWRTFTVRELEVFWALLPWKTRGTPMGTK
ncbi:MAG: hypothetical protein C4326_05800 [Ignavibacteria bacterium]